MANLDLIAASDRSDFFRQTILTNLGYWHTWLEAHQSDLSTLDRERNAIVKAISFALKIEDNSWPSIFALITTLSPLMERRGHWDMWYWVLTRSIEAAQRMKDAAAEVTLLALLARLLAQQSRFQESTRHYRQVIRLARRIGDEFHEARACTNLGYYYIERGFWQRAEVLCCHALVLFEQLDSDHGRAHTENHLGILHIRQHRWEQAEYHLERACEIWQMMGDEHGLMRGYLNLGGLYNDAGKPNQALSALEKALQQALQSGENIVIGRVYLNQGKAYRLLGDLTQAKDSLRKAETIFQQYVNLIEQARVWNELGLAYFQQGEWTQSVFYLEKSLAVWRSINIQFGEIEVLLDLGECELARGDYSAALRHWQEVERLIGPTAVQGIYRHLQPRLDNYWRSLVSLRAAGEAA